MHFQHNSSREIHDFFIRFILDTIHVLTSSFFFRFWKVFQTLSTTHNVKSEHIQNIYKTSTLKSNQKRTILLN